MKRLAVELARNAGAIAIAIAFVALICMPKCHLPPWMDP